MNKEEDMYLLMETTSKVERIMGVPRSYLEVNDIDAAWEALNKISVFICNGLAERRKIQKSRI